jgi:NAD(P)-dependent dehydrogenase (short-subunit alcohol dehydrogenase family)
MKSFDGKVAAITGAGSGIGRALALQLAAEGCALALSDINEANIADTAQLASQRNVKVTKSVVDVSNRTQMLEWAANVVADHGKVNLVFNNAGVAHAGTIEGSTFEDFEWIVGINLWGVINGTKAFLPLLKQSRDGHIINVSSVFGLFAQPGMSGYNATKYAVRGFTESLRMELDMTSCGVSASCVLHKNRHIAQYAHVEIDGRTSAHGKGRSSDDGKGYLFQHTGGCSEHHTQWCAQKQTSDTGRP